MTRYLKSSTPYRSKGPLGEVGDLVAFGGSLSGNEVGLVVSVEMDLVGLLPGFLRRWWHAAGRKTAASFFVARICIAPPLSLVDERPSGSCCSLAIMGSFVFVTAVDRRRQSA